MIERFDEDGRPLLTVLRLRRPFPADAAEFFTAPEELLQVGLLSRPAGHAVPVHVHNPVQRLTVGTAEVLLVMEGMIVITAYGRTAHTCRLGPGDAAVIHPGTRHEVEWTTAARVLEVKSGPYGGREADKGE